MLTQCAPAVSARHEMRWEFVFLAFLVVCCSSQETQDMIRDLTVQDLRAMLRKRGCNPAGGREMLQERLTHYLLVRLPTPEPFA